MGTAGGEPRVLLNALKPMLGVVGDIKTPHEVMRVVGMMKDAEKLMSRCIYLNILKATSKNADKEETLHKFLSIGGWGILNKWLMEFTKTENYPILLELIDVLKVLPITVDLLKQGNTGKIMKSMTKLEHGDVKRNATGLIKQWKSMIRIREAKNKPAKEEEVEEAGSQEPEKTDSSVQGEQDEKMKRKLALDSSKVLDSSGFMNALNITPPVKKRRRASNDANTKKASMPLDELLKDTPVEKTEENEGIEDAGSPERPEEDASVSVYHSPAVEAANAALAQDAANTVIVDEGSLARKKNKKKRNITWAPDDKLVQVSYFELMEGEKKGGHTESFSQARQMELLLEKQATRAVRREDRMVVKVEWKCLIPVDNAGVPGLIPGEKSKQKFIQAEREKSVLAYIFLSKQSLPDYPAEPDFNPDELNHSHQATIIPHDEEQTVLPPTKVTTQRSSQQPTSSVMPTTVQSSSASQISQPTAVINKPGGPSLSPAVQNIMSHLQQQMNTSPTIPPLNVLPHMVPPALLGQPGLAPPFPFPNTPNIPPPNIPPPNIPPPNIPPPNINQQLANNVNNSLYPLPPKEQTVGLMDVNIPNIRGVGNRGDGPRFTGGRGFNNNVPRDGDGGFNTSGGPSCRGRWSGAPNQAPQQWNTEWDDNKNNDDNNYNDNYDGSFRGRGHVQNTFDNQRGQHRGGRGFRRGGDNFHRGRGGINRGRGKDRGRGKNDRGRGNNRGRGNINDNHRRHSANKDWSYDDNRNYGNDSIREQDHYDNLRSHDDRNNGNKR